jgi:hypothetical protein
MDRKFEWGFLLCQVDEQLRDQSHVTKTVCRPSPIQLVSLNYQFEGVSLPCLRVGWNHVKMAANERHCTRGPLRAVLQHEVATPLNEGYMFGFQDSSILHQIGLESCQHMFHRSGDGGRGEGVGT